MVMVSYIKMLKDVAHKVGISLDGLLNIVNNEAVHKDIGEIKALMNVAQEFHIIGYDNCDATRQKHISFQTGIPFPKIQKMWNKIADEITDMMDSDDVYRIISDELGMQQVEVITI